MTYRPGASPSIVAMPAADVTAGGMTAAPALADASCGVTVTVAPGITPPLGSETVTSNFEFCPSTCSGRPGLVEGRPSDFELSCAATGAASADTPRASATKRRRITSLLLRDLELGGVDLAVDLDLLE